MSRKKVLVVEDVEDNRELLVQYFRDVYDVYEARDGRECIELAEKVRPDLILMDLSLPVLDGWQAASALKADARLKGIPIIAVTAHAMVGDDTKALSAGCDAYISKPIDFVELEKVMKNLLGQT